MRRLRRQRRQNKLIKLQLTEKASTAVAGREQKERAKRQWQKAKHQQGQKFKCQTLQGSKRRQGIKLLRLRRQLSFPYQQPSQEGKVNVNTAGVKELMDLPGIGEKKAQAIMDYRNRAGTFRSLSDLGKVKGIGPKMLEKLKALVIF